MRRRLPRVFSVCVSQRAADGLLLALDDSTLRRPLPGRPIAGGHPRQEPRIHIDRRADFEVVLHEVAVGRPVWESQRLLDGFVSESPLDEFVRDRAGQSLAHVFTLLSLVLPREPLQIAFRSLHTDDNTCAGPRSSISKACCRRPSARGSGRFSCDAATARLSGRAHDNVIADLLRSSPPSPCSGIAAQRDTQPRLRGFPSD